MCARWSALALGLHELRVALRRRGAAILLAPALVGLALLAPRLASVRVFGGHLVGGLRPGLLAAGGGLPGRVDRVLGLFQHADSPLGERPHVDCLRAPVGGLGLVLDLCPVRQRLEAVAGDTAVMYEEVLADLVGCDKAEALVVVEPLHRSGGHVATSTD